MKKPIHRLFFFKEKSNQEVVDELDNTLPINLKYQEDLIERIYIRYPLIDKWKIAIIVKTLFQTLRELLILGKILHFNNIFFDTKLFFFPRYINKQYYCSARVKMCTPSSLREIPDVQSK